MKKLIALLITIFSIYFIYYTYHNKTINYLVLSDNIMHRTPNYNDYLKDKRVLINDYFTNNQIYLLYEDILTNRTIKINNHDYYLKKSLRESDLVVISIGMEEISKYYDKYDMNKNKEYFNKLFNDIEILIREIKKYAQDKILFLGFYNPTNYYDSKVDELFFEYNTKLNRLMINNNIIYIDLYELVKGNYQDNGIYLNSNAHQKIANIIEFYLE